MHPIQYEKRGKDDTQTEVTIALTNPSTSNSDVSQLPPLLYTTERKLMFKIDCRLVPCLSVLCLLCFLDRANVGNALVYGLCEDLHISDVQYSTALTMFCITYIVFEIPCNILLKRWTPRVWLSICMFVFGLATLATGFVQNYGGLLGLRSVLGMAEAGIMPGCAYLMSAWYTRQEAQRRFSFYLSAMNLSSGFGGLIAAPIGNMDGAGGLSGWRWIFIVEGAATCLISLSLFILLANFPEQVSWLTEEEREFVKARLKAEQGSSAIELSIRPFDVWQTLCDPKVILAAMIHLSTSVPGYMGAYFAPVIVESLGVFSPIETQLHTVPIWAVTFGLALIVAYISDLIRHRYAMAVFCAAVSVVGYSILFSVHEDNVNVRYGALFMAIAGAASLMPVEICWNTTNLGGHRRRAIGSAWQVGIGNIGGIIGYYAFRKQDAPKYQLSYAICIGFSCSAAVFCSLYAGYCWRENRRRAAQGWGRELSEEEKAQMGDLSPSYRFMI